MRVVSKTFAVRPASVADAEGLVALDTALARAGVGMVLTVDQVRSIDDERRRIDATYAEMSAGRATLCVVAEHTRAPNQIIGSASLMQLTPARCSHVGLVAVGVDPEFRRQGVAREMIRHLIDHAKSFGLLRLELYVRADNSGAHALYRSLGFHHEGTRVRFVRLEDGTFVDDQIWALFLEA